MRSQREQTGKSKSAAESARLGKASETRPERSAARESGGSRKITGRAPAGEAARKAATGAGGQSRRAEAGPTEAAAGGRGRSCRQRHRLLPRAHPPPHGAAAQTNQGIPPRARPALDRQYRRARPEKRRHHARSGRAEGHEHPGAQPDRQRSGCARAPPAFASRNSSSKSSRRKPKRAV